MSFPRVRRGEDPIWEDESFETDLLVVFVIPYDEFCRVRDAGLEEYMDRRLYEDGIKKLLTLLDEKGIDVPGIRSVLSRALEYHSYVEYSQRSLYK